MPRLTENWPDPSGHIHPYEFRHPNKLHPDLVSGLGETRLHLSRPMYLTQSRSARPIHPHGDGVPPNSGSHAVASLHKWSIDHTRSAKQGQAVFQGSALARAQDFDVNTADPEELWEVYLQLERLNLWTGIGLYPAWQRPGFHVDLRERDHPHWGARWYRDAGGTYHRLSWANWKAVLA